MNINHEDNFISVFENVYPDGFCRHLIEDFDYLKKNGAGWDRLTFEGAHAHHKQDHAINLNLRTVPLEYFNNQDSTSIFFDGLQNCFDEYVKKYSILKEMKIKTNNMKAQKTSPGGGYHVWHFEQGPDHHSERVLVFMLYLNTLAPENCGETEFLYQQKRYTPTENTVIIWPSSYTHTHRGNPVYGNIDKYVITGWFSFT